MEEVWVAPGIRLDQYDDSRRLEIYQKRTSAWILAHAIDLSKRPGGELASMILVCSVIEPMGGILTGSRTALERFTAGFKYILPDLVVAKDVYERLRGGLYHEGFIKAGMLMAHGLKEAIEVRNGHVLVDPVRLVTVVNDGFQRFCGDIQNDVDGLQKRFHADWEKKVVTNIAGLENTHPLEAPNIVGATSAPTLLSYDPRYVKKF